MRWLNKGYTLAEMCAVLVIVSLFMNLCVPVSTGQISTFYQFPDAYLLKQSEALCRTESTVYEDDEGHVVYFNAAGNVKSAGTMHFRHRDIVVELGGGRIVIR